MTRFFILLMIMMFGTSAKSNEIGLDSLKKSLAQTKTDTAKALKLAEIAFNYLWLNPDSSYAYSVRAYELSQKHNFLKGKLISLTYLARFWWTLGEYANSIELLLSTINEMEKLPSVSYHYYGVLSDSYFAQGFYNEAILYNIKSIEVAQSEPSCTYCRITYFSLAYKFLKKNELDSAMYYLQVARTFPKDQGFEGWPLMVTGAIYEAKYVYDSAFYYYKSSIAKLSEENNKKDLADAYNHLASLFQDRLLSDSAIFYLNKSIELSQENNFVKEKMQSFLQLSATYDHINKDSAYYYFKTAVNVKDSLFSQQKQRQLVSSELKALMKQNEINSLQKQFQVKIRTNILLGSTTTFLLIGLLLWRNNRRKQKDKEKIESAYNQLKSTQAQLIQSEKMASLGELTAGIAHEIQNPLNFVNNFSEVSNELIEELKTELATGNRQQATEIVNDISQNLEKINHHGKRADSIVKSMLQHSQRSTSQKELTDINVLCDEYLRLAFHGMRAKDKNFNAKFETDFDPSLPKVSVVPQDIGRVMLNLLNNAFYVVNERSKEGDAEYQPIVSVTTKLMANSQLQITVKDNGSGIPENIKDKIFQPFFTTKPTGQGTGLGLSLSYDIVKAHGGEINLVANETSGTSFAIILPV